MPDDDADNATDSTTDHASEQPRAVTWFYVLCGLCLLLALTASVLGVVGLTGEPATDASMSAEEFYSAARTLVILGAPLTVGYGIAPFLPQTKLTWAFHLVLITFAMFFVITMVIAIPLAVAWFGEALQAAYGVGSDGDDGDASVPEETSHQA